MQAWGVYKFNGLKTLAKPWRSFRGDPFSRPRWASRMGALSWGLDLANFEGVPVRLAGFEMENVQMLWSAFVAQIVRQIRVREPVPRFCSAETKSLTSTPTGFPRKTLEAGQCKQS